MIPVLPSIHSIRVVESVKKEYRKDAEKKNVPIAQESGAFEPAGGENNGG